MSVTTDAPRSATPESTAWRLLGGLVPGSLGKIKAIAVAAFLSTAFESLALLLVVGSAVQPADGTTADGLVGALDRGSDATRASITIGACVALLVVHVVGTSLTSRLARDVVRTTRDAAVDRYLDAPWSVQQHEGEGRLQETTSSLSTLSSNAGIALAGEIAGLIGLLVLLTASVAVDPVSTAVVIVIGTTIFLVLRPLARATQSNATRFVLANAEYNEEVTRVASMARELRAFGVADVARSRLSGRNADVADHLRLMRFTTRLGTDLYRDLSLLALAALITVVVIAREELVVGFTAVLVLSLRSLSYASTFQANRQTLREQIPNLVELDRRLTQLEPDDRSGSLVPETLDEIRFDAVSYRYPDGRQALRETSFTLRRGDMMVVTGPSGAGKSTLLDILSGLRAPTSGAVTIDGHPLAELESAAWTQLVGFVPQEPSLLPATVRENITFFRAGYTDDDVLRAARDASVLEDIERLPDGLDTRLGPRGVGLSGGQKQRVAIARALLDEPALLLLDEPSSALDRGAQLAVEATFGRLKGSVTIVLVTHREVLADAEADHTLALRSPHD